MQKKRIGADRLILIDDAAIMVPQASLLMAYCSSMKAYLSSPAVKSKVLFYFAKKREIKRKEEEKARRQEAEEEEHAKLLHNGKMAAYLAAEKGSFEIQGDLQAQTSEGTGRKREKGKEREVVLEEGRRTKARAISPVPEEEDEHGMVYL